MTHPLYRLVNPTDLDTLLSLGLFQKNHKPLVFLQFLIDQENLVLVEEEGEVLGIAANDYMWSDVPMLSFLEIIKRENRRKGYGRGLVEHLSHVLKKRGHTTLFSSTMIENLISQKFHESMGFEEVGSVNFNLQAARPEEIFYKKML